MVVEDVRACFLEAGHVFEVDNGVLEVETDVVIRVRAGVSVM